MQPIQWTDVHILITEDNIIEVWGYPNDADTYELICFKLLPAIKE